MKNLIIQEICSSYKQPRMKKLYLYLISHPQGGIFGSYLPIQMKSLMSENASDE